jgi:tryptophanyl-tRNA synthetase
LEAAKDPSTCNVFALYSLFASQEEQDVLATLYRAGGMGYGAAKSELLAKIDAYFAPARERRRELAANPAQVETWLAQGAERARAIAGETMRLVRSSVGLRSMPS